MKISLNLIKEYVDVKLGVDELVEKIGAQLGAVEEIVDYGKKYTGIVVAKVVECMKHPDADKLTICKIDDGGNVKDIERDSNGLVQVVCGAPNVKEGMLVVWLPPGTTVPATYEKDPLVLEAREIRGQMSNGMLASASELGFSDDHTGIVELTFGEPGDDLAANLGIDNDFVLDIENKMFTHRPDCFGVIGVAREIAGITGLQFKSGDKYTENPESPQTKSKLTVSVKNSITKLVPRFTALVIEDVKVKPVSLWMQARLRQVGIRPINNVVDVTNFTMHLMGQPTHAYDYDKLCEVAGTTTPQLETRLSKKGDKLKLLNGKTITFDDEDTILITSNNVPVGIGGVMGGADTEVDENTAKVVLESANFDMYSIRRASMRHGLFTDAVARFNKGQSPLQCLTVLYQCAGWIQHQAMLQGASGKIGKVTDVHAKLQKPVAVHVTDAFINERLGLELGIREMAKLLTNVEFGVTVSGPTLVVAPPFWRTDIEIPEDVVEEVGRLYGYDHLPLNLPVRDLTPPPKDELLELKTGLREALSAAGANEVLTYSFVHGNLLEKVGQDKTKAYELANALSPDLQFYRLSLTPNLLDKVHPNIRSGYGEFAIFEFGKVHMKGIMDSAEPKVPQEDEHLALVFSADDKTAGLGAPFYMAKHYLEQLLSDATMQLVPLDSHDFKGDEWGKQMAAPYEPKRSGVVIRDGLIRGVVGEFRAEVRSALKLPGFAAGFEVGLDLLRGSLQRVYVNTPRFPRVEQDISLRVPAELAYSELFNLVKDQVKKLSPKNVLIDFSPLDIYQKQDDKRHKQVTFRLHIASYDRTLIAEEVNALLDEAAKAAKQVLGAERL